MIEVCQLSKRYRTLHGPGKWVLQDVSLTIPPRTNVGLIGRNGAGKSTLLRLIGGVDYPTRGEVRRHCRVSWPIGVTGGLHGSMTGRQSVRFVCRVHGVPEQEIPSYEAYVQDFSELTEAFDEPIQTYSTGMSARLRFALSLAFKFDVYLSDEITAVGDAVFRKKAQQIFRELVDRAGLIMVAHQDNILRDFCQAGVWLHEGGALWFDDINDALKAYHASN